MNVARVVMETIRDLGGKHFFCLPGRAIYPLLNEMARIPEVRYVNALHEFSLTAAADGYARASGEVAFLGLYMSTGVMNASSALFMAHRDKIPMVVIATQTESWGVTANARAESAGILDAVRPVTKWAWQVPTAERAQEALLRAYAIATTPPCGPAFVAIPVDFWGVDVPRFPNPAAARPRTAMAAGAGLEELAGWIADARQPVFVVGGEAVTSGAAPSAVALAERLNAIVLSEPEPSFIPTDTHSPSYCGELTPSCASLPDADLVLYIGVNTLEREHTPVLTTGRAKRHVFIGTDELKVHEAITYDAVFVGSIPATVDSLAQAVPTRSTPVAARVTWAAERDRLVAAADDELPLNIPVIATTLRERLPADAVIVEHATTAAATFRKTFYVPSSGHYIAASGSNQGWGGAAAPGVKLARPNVPVVAVIGDGGFMFSPQSVYTSVQFNAAVIYVVLNNGGWGSMDASVRKDAPMIGEMGIDLGYSWSIDVAAVAAGLGAQTAVANTRAEFISALDAALASGRTSFISVASRRIGAGPAKPTSVATAGNSK
jgi:thiamine pyrophosphate-dependent acetolactate synthase large subunit-like protein